MTTTSVENIAISEPVAPQKGPRWWTFLMAVVGTITAYAAMLAAKGNGWSPLLFLLLGMIATPVLGIILAGNRRGGAAWLRRGVGLVIVAAVSLGLANYSTRIDATQAFSEVLGTPPPAGVSDVRARRQWCDGPNTVVLFTADRATIDAVLQARRYDEPMSVYLPEGEALAETEKRRRLLMTISVPFADPDWLVPRGLAAPLWWSTDIASGARDPGHGVLYKVIWDEATHQAIAVVITT